MSKGLGNINTNFRGKAEAALEELRNGKDFVYVHIEAPDECGHRFEIENKVRSIELIDELVVGTLLKGLADYDDFSLMVLPTTQLRYQPGRMQQTRTIHHLQETQRKAVGRRRI